MAKIECVAAGLFFLSAALLATTLVAVAVYLAAQVNSMTARIRLQPHILLVVVDDLGWNDISFHNPAVKTPVIKKLASEGTILDQHYSQPTGAAYALLTGKYPFRGGMQHTLLSPLSPECSPPDTTIAQKLKSQGYATHLVGKWHQGFCRSNCTPTARGFDTFYGFYNGQVDHYTKEVDGGYDWRDGERVDLSAAGIHSTDLITKRTLNIIKKHSEHNMTKPLFLYVSMAAVHSPLQAPSQYYAMYADEPNQKRRHHLGMMSMVDSSIGLFVEALKERGLYENTVTIFFSDNGGENNGGSSNFPLRGAKMSLWEGGTRTPAFVHSPTFKVSENIHNGLFHIVDWYPTIVDLAKGSLSDNYTDNPCSMADLDGKNQSDMLLYGMESIRSEVVYNIDDQPPQFSGKAAIRIGKYKLIEGFPGLFDGWHGTEDGVGYTHEHVDRDLHWEVNISMLEANNHGEEETEGRHTGATWRKRRGIQYTSRIRETIETMNSQHRLYNLADDPEERHNLASLLPEKVEELKARLEEHREKLKKPLENKETPRGSPTNFSGIWSPGWC